MDLSLDKLAFLGDCPHIRGLDPGASCQNEFIDVRAIPGKYPGGQVSLRLRIRGGLFLSSIGCHREWLVGF
jgi:hypothetical protein